jgi:hypothetical protein
MLTLISALFTIIWFAFTKGVWCLGFSIIVRSEQFATVSRFIKGLISHVTA